MILDTKFVQIELKMTKLWPFLSHTTNIWAFWRHFCQLLDPNGPIVYAGHLQLWFIVTTHVDKHVYKIWDQTELKCGFYTGIYAEI